MLHMCANIVRGTTPQTSDSLMPRVHVPLAIQGQLIHGDKLRKRCAYVRLVLLCGRERHYNSKAS